MEPLYNFLVFFAFKAKSLSKCSSAVISDKEILDFCSRRGGCASQRPSLTTIARAHLRPAFFRRKGGD